jgi:hypothetical protein
MCSALVLKDKSIEQEQEQAQVKQLKIDNR